MSNESVDELIEQLKELKLKEEELLEKIIIARAAEKKSATNINSSQKQFTVGERVYITNQLGSYIRGKPTVNDRRAFVTKVTKARVYIKTVNGRDTWRSRNNLRIVGDQDSWDS